MTIFSKMMILIYPNFYEIHSFFILNKVKLWVVKFRSGKYLPVWLLWRWQKSVSHLNNGIQIVIGWICWSLIGWCRKPCQKVPIRIWHKLIHFRFFISIKNLSFCIDVARRSIYSENLLEMGHFPRFFRKFHIERLNFFKNRQNFISGPFLRFFSTKFDLFFSWVYWIKYNLIFSWVMCLTVNIDSIVQYLHFCTFYALSCGC